MWPPLWKRYRGMFVIVLRDERNVVLAKECVTFLKRRSLKSYIKEALRKSGMVKTKWQLLKFYGADVIVRVIKNQG